MAEELHEKARAAEPTEASEPPVAQAADLLLEQLDEAEETSTGTEVDGATREANAHDKPSDVWNPSMMST